MVSGNAHQASSHYENHLRPAQGVFPRAPGRTGVLLSSPLHCRLWHDELVHTSIEALPCAESAFTRRFKFDSADNPKLRALRQRYQLDTVVASGRDLVLSATSRTRT